MQEALELLRRAQYTDDPLALDRAIDLLRAGLASHIGEPVQAAYLSNLGGALRIRFERTGHAPMKARLPKKGPEIRDQRRPRRDGQNFGGRGRR